METRHKTYYRRNLPHWQPANAAIFLTWQLEGSLPRSARERLVATRALLNREAARAGEDADKRQSRHSKRQFAVLDQILDKAESGPLWLKQDGIAAIVQEGLLSRYGELYTLWAYVVMANHVHVLLQPKQAPTLNIDSVAEPVYHPLKDLTKRLKGYTALEANRLLGRTGQSFWQQESFDHWARDEGEFYRIIAYIENNPVKAGLALRPEDWLWSSASERVRRGWNEIRALT